MPDRAHRTESPRSTDSPTRASGRAAPAPGNQARIRLSALDPRAVARSGFGGGHPLPHGRALGRVFGKYDVGGIRAHTGEAAQVASRTLGARAYAMGEDVAFRGLPSLGTTAHEVTHVLAQRAHIGPSGPMGRAGDRYEKLADSVAERARRGESAEGLLDRTIGRKGLKPGARRPALPVQREIGDAAAKGDVVTDGSTRWTIIKVETAPDGSKVYSIKNPDMLLPYEVPGDEPIYSRYVETPDSAPIPKLRSKPSMWSRAFSHFGRTKDQAEKRTRSGVHSYARIDVETEYEEDDVDVLESRRSYARHAGTMGVDSGPTSSSMLSRAGTVVDTVSSVSQFGLDRVIDRTMDVRLTTEERIRRTLPKSSRRKVEEKVGQLFQVLGGVVQTAVPVIGGALASPLTGVGDSMETHSSGISKSKSVVHGGMTVGKDTGLGAIPFYGNYVGFVGMCSDAKRLFSSSKGPTKLETLRQLKAQRADLEQIGAELTGMGFDPYERLEGYRDAMKVLNRYIDKYEEKIAALERRGKAGLTKYAGGFG